MEYKDGLTQEQRLIKLVEAFKADSDEYKNIKTPQSIDGKRQLLRSLMNIRMPKYMPPEILQLQDDYLKERIREIGRA